MMMKNLVVGIRLQRACAAACMLLIGARIAVGQAGYSAPGHALMMPNAQGGSATPTNSVPAAQPATGPHGGRISSTQMYQFEVAFYPKETRIFLHSPSQGPLSAKGVSGQATMQVRGNPQASHFPLKYVPAQPGSNDQDYLAVGADVSQVRDGDMQASFELANLPYQQEPRVQFAQSFALSHAPLQVVVAEFTDADREAVARQKVCPVSHEAFDHDTPVKLMIGDRVLYLCCKDCIEEVQKNPQAYYAQAQAVAVQRPVQQSVSVETATAADEAAIRAQSVCPVSGQRLGGMGTPLRVTINGQTLYVCCKGCVARVEKDPAKYFAKVAQSQNVR
jgi:YHS domain-containing protein